IELQDVEEANLLQHLPMTCRFIEEALSRQDQRVLVHCQAGVSRSAAVVIAYIMKMERLPYEQALAYVQTTRASVCPNAGFSEQCQLFATMNFTIDEHHLHYRQFMLRQSRPGEYAMGQGGHGSWMARCHIVVNGSLPPSTTRPSPATAPPPSGLSIRCRKCRSVAIPPYASAFSPHRRATSAYGASSTSSPSAQCSSYFVEPMDWIDGLTDGSNEGKILCPKCAAKLGQYNWSGAQCSCGAWITPAIALHRNRVDAL
ncbi:protein-tyrosine phosphatase-like protein, partial [Syncephalis pseudoplumigaleata]